MFTPPAGLPDQLEILVADMNGIPRGKLIQGRSIANGSLPHLALSHFFQTITGGYADLIDVHNPKDEDMLLMPEWETYRRTPWKENNCGQVICRTMTKRGEPITYDPRNCLRTILAAYEERGWRPIIAPEVEFFLVEPISDADLPLVPATGEQGRVESGGESFSVDALESYSEFIATLNQVSTDADIRFHGLAHEMAPAQMELNVHHGEALSRADELFMLKRLVKACAVQHEMVASFMAKPMEDHPGSGLHLHVSIFDQDDNNILALNGGEAGEGLLHFIGGLQEYLPQAFALMAPTVNSFKRFQPELAAPFNLEWGYDNRTAGLRVPYDDDRNGRVENRIAGADANPYLFIATTLACGLLGLERKVLPRAPLESSAYDLEPTFPMDMYSALRRLDACDEIKSLLGKNLVDIYIDVKRTELAHFDAEIHPWERRFLADAL
ncbi:MAG: glutamine synthetase [Pseudomonadales bacterium]|nr:glutamine synthetase [Pseudomonadales bacterium]